jgi:hypothetical protein
VEDTETEEGGKEMDREVVKSRKGREIQRCRKGKMKEEQEKQKYNRKG